VPKGFSDSSLAHSSPIFDVVSHYREAFWAFGHDKSAIRVNLDRYRNGGGIADKGAQSRSGSYEQPAFASRRSAQNASIVGRDPWFVPDVGQ